MEEEIQRLTMAKQELVDRTDSLKAQLTAKDREVSSLLNDLNVTSRQNKSLALEATKLHEAVQEHRRYQTCNLVNSMVVGMRSKSYNRPFAQRRSR